MSHGINANVVHGWRKLARGGSGSGSGRDQGIKQQEFVPVGLAEAAVARTGERAIEVELRRGAVTMRINWPLSAASDFAAWTRELLR